MYWEMYDGYRSVNVRTSGLAFRYDWWMCARMTVLCGSCLRASSGVREKEQMFLFWLRDGLDNHLIFHFFAR